MYEFVFSINGMIWSRQTVKRKSTQTMFMPIIQSPGINNSDQKINLIIYQTKSALVCFLRYQKPSTIHLYYFSGYSNYYSSNTKF